MAEIGLEAKTFRGATRSVCAMLVKGKIRKQSSKIDLIIVPMKSKFEREI